jgi:hypothetical protein
LILFDAVRIAQFGQEGTWASLEPGWKVTAPFVQSAPVAFSAFTAKLTVSSFH